MDVTNEIMRWLLVAAILVATGATWFEVTDTSPDGQRAGGLSAHEEVQPFDPYLADGPEPGESEPEFDAPESIPGQPEISGGDEAEMNASESDPDSAPPEGVVFTASEARRFADTYLSAAATDPDRILELYSHHVEYYDQGTVTRSDVLQDKQRYLRRWPEREYERSSDVELIDAGTTDVIRFNYQYAVASGPRATRGTGWSEIGVQERDGRLYIVSERGGVFDR